MKKSIEKAVTCFVVLVSIFLVAQLGPVLAEEEGPDAAQFDLTPRLEGAFSLIELGLQLIERFGEKAWPGFSRHLPPVLLRAGEYDYLIGHPHPPKGFQVLNEKAGLYRKEGHILPLPVATSYPVGGIPSVILPLRSELQRMIDRKMGKGEFLLTEEDYVRMVLHEGFHAYQMRVSGGPGELPTFGFHGSAERMGELLQSSSKWVKGTAEAGKILLEALKVDSLARARSAVEKAFGANRAPSTSTYSETQIISFERQVQWIEGTARYVETELIAEAARVADYGEVVRSSPEETRNGLYNSLQERLVGPTPVRDRLAALGALKGLILDRLFPGWKKVLFRDKRGMDDLLSSSLAVPGPLADFPVTEVGIGGRKLTVALADRPGFWSRGLQMVSDLKGVEGMVFYFPADTERGFWMKDTEMPLQIGFFDKSKKLLESVTMEPCSRPRCPVFSPRGEYRYVLEIPASSDLRLEEMVGAKLEIGERR